MSERIKGETMFDLAHFPENKWPILRAIDKVKDHPGHGAAYQGSSELAGRHPVKPDTTAILSRESASKQPGHIVEFGTAYGFSTLYLAYGAPQAEITTYEFDPEVAREALDLFNEANLNAEVVPGTVEGNTDLLRTKPPIDLVFIDHNKGSYLPDFRAIEEYLSPRAVILADNVNDRRAECQDFVDYMMANYRTHIEPTQAGLLIAER